LRFSKEILKKGKYHISLKPIQPEPMCSMRTDTQTDRQTDIMKLIVAFHNLANALQTNCKRWEQRGSGLILVTVAADAWKDCVKVEKFSVRIVSLRASFGIQTIPIMG
jgi:hypothetical protein